MIGLSRLEKSYGGRTLFEDVSLQLNAGSRYGLVGANGSGKTTLPQDPRRRRARRPSGTRRHPKRRAHRRAPPGPLPRRRATSILDVAMTGDARRRGTRSRSSARASSSTATATRARLAELEDVASAHTTATRSRRAPRAVLEGLGIPVAVAPAAARDALRRLQAARAARAGAPRRAPTSLLLDEPTNHLDILSIRWLEKFLAGYQGCALVISHDQRFLDNVATHILDVDYGTITLYTGNYSAFVAREGAPSASARRPRSRAPRRSSRRSAPSSSASAPRPPRRKQAQSRLKQIEKIEVEELADAARAARRCSASRRSGRAARDVLEVAGVVEGVRRRSRCSKDVSLVGAPRREGRRSSARTASASRRCSRSSIERLARRRGRR